MPEGNFFTSFNDILRTRAERGRARVFPLGGDTYSAPARWNGAGATTAAKSASISLADCLGVLRRHWRLALGATTLLTLIAAGITWQMPVRYRGEAVVLLDTRDMQVRDLDAAIPARLFDLTKVRGEIEVLKSRSLAESVVDKLHLADDPEFGGVATALAGSAARRRERAINTLVGRLDVENDGRSLVLKIDVSAASRQSAAGIANAYAEVYLEHQIAIKEAAMQRASEWLNQQITTLRAQLATAEEKIGRYKEAHDITSTHGTVTAQELADINTQLIAAHTDLVQKEAALHYARQVLASPDGAAAAGQVLASPLIQRLREQEADLLRQTAELSTRYRPAHPTMIRLKSELDDVRHKIADEASRLVQVMADEVNAAGTREEALKENLAHLAQATARQEDAEIELNELQREADASRTLYEAVLTRFKQTSAQQELQVPDAQIVSRADPAASRAWPDRPQRFAMMEVLSLILGITLPFVVELLDPSFRRPEDIEAATGLPALGVLPEVELRRDGQPGERAETWLAEAMRGIRSGLRMAQGGVPSGVLLITSTGEGEGKSFFATTLGRSVIRARLKCLIIDCHFQRPALDKVLAPTPAQGLPAGSYPQIQVDKTSGLHYVSAPAPEQRRLFRSQDLFESAEMREYIQRMRGHYDLIILDAPPAPATADLAALGRLADAALFLVRWGRTPRQRAIKAVQQLRERGVGIAGVVLSRVELRRFALYGQADSVRYLKSTPAPARGAR
ncbi:MAG TPA: polysaccharide biosynthesis tyrosine autokinase [Stellaceae bacterium]|nr:polysaccharide biosynthesis tyrosine autokinase [Stellaceae bacterium]